MTRRTKDNVKFWDKKIDTLFTEIPKSQLTEYRYAAVMKVMRDSFPRIKEIPQADFTHMLQTASYLERQMRYKTEGNQQKIKEILSQEKVVELYK